MIDELDYKHYKDLADAIILQAFHDYAAAIVRNERGTMQECKRFFNSGWYEDLSDTSLNGKSLADEFKKRVVAFRKSAIDVHDKKIVSKKRMPKYRTFVCPVCGGNVYARISKKQKRYKVYCANCSTQMLWDSK